MKKALISVLAVILSLQIFGKANQEEKELAALYPKMKSLFGCKLGDKCVTNSVVRLEANGKYSFKPRKKFMTFNEYGFMATPKTKKIYSIFARADKMSDAEFENVKAVIEKKFGKKMIRMTNVDVAESWALIGKKGESSRCLALSKTSISTIIWLAEDNGIDKYEKEKDELKKVRQEKIISKEIDSL